MCRIREALLKEDNIPEYFNGESSNYKDHVSKNLQKDTKSRNPRKIYIC